MMVKKVIVIYIVVLLLVSVSFVVFEATIQGGIKDDFVSTKQSFADGSGTEDDPYMIYDLHDLQGMIADLEAYYALANDIDASETTEWNDGAGFEPIGKYSVLTPYREPFIGSFDGRNHTITGLYIYRPSRRHVGFFGDVAEEGEVRNVGVIDVNITGAREVGGLVGGNYGMVENSYVSGNVSGNTYVGGLVGRQRDGTLLNSYATVTVRVWVGSEDGQDTVYFYIDLEGDDPPHVPMYIDSVETEEDTATVEWISHSSTRVDYYEIRLDGGEWMKVGTSTTYTFQNLEERRYAVTVRMWDNAVDSWQDTAVFTIGGDPP